MCYNEPTRVEVGVHVRHFGLYQLELPDGNTKLFPLVGVVKGRVAAGLHDPCKTRVSRRRTFLPIRIQQRKFFLPIPVGSTFISQFRIRITS